MAKPTRPERKEFRRNSGRFIQGEYSPARRPTPTTSIPPRASAYPVDVVKVRSRYPRSYTGTRESDLTRVPTIPQAVAIWQYDPPQYEAKSSIATLSLAISEATRARGPQIDEIDTNPPRHQESGDGYFTADMPQTDITTLDTVPPPVISPGATLSLSFRHPIDRLRWWLLAPGRIEFIMWLAGTALLICVTGLLVLTMAAGLFHPAQQQETAVGIPCSNATNTQPRTSKGESCIFSAVSSTTGLHITMLNGDLMETDTSLQLHGQGFQPLGSVTFTHDANLPCQPGVIQANEQGEFSVLLRLDEKAYWGAGKHQIKITDSKSKHSLILTIMLSPQK